MCGPKLYRKRAGRSENYAQEVQKLCHTEQIRASQRAYIIQTAPARDCAIQGEKGFCVHIGLPNLHPARP